MTLIFFFFIVLTITWKIILFNEDLIIHLKNIPYLHEALYTMLLFFKNVL